MQLFSTVFENPLKSLIQDECVFFSIFENCSKCRIWCWYLKCKLSSLRSQYWMRLFGDFQTLCAILTYIEPRPKELYCQLLTSKSAGRRERTIWFVISSFPWLTNKTEKVFNKKARTWFFNQSESSFLGLSAHSVLFRVLNKSESSMLSFVYSFKRIRIQHCWLARVLSFVYNFEPISIQHCWPAR